MTFSLGIVGAGQFSGQFAKLCKAPSRVGDVFVTDLLPERAERLVGELRAGGHLSHLRGDAGLATSTRSRSSRSAGRTARWWCRRCAPGKHVYSAVPMAITGEEIADIIEEVRRTGLTYMMGETSYYNPATVHARDLVAKDAFGRLFYAEGDYVHDMDLGFYDAYKYSGGENWKATASYPPLLYPTHALGGILGAWRTHAVSVSAIGVTDDRGDGVFDKEVSMFDNDFSNATALFEAAGGGSFRTNEFRRVGYPSHIRESRFRFFGTQGEPGAARHGEPVAGQRRGHRHQRLDGDPVRRCRRTTRRCSTSPRRCATRSHRARAGARPEPAAGGVRGRPQRPRGQPPLPGRRLRGRGDDTARCRR